MNVFVSYLCWAVLCSPALTSGQFSSHDRHKRAAPPSLDDRTKCGPGDQWPVTRVNSTQRLQDMRAAMTAVNVHAFIVLSDDAHNSEYPAQHDLRRGFISGFSGSAGWAVVTMDKAALWTDGRYFLEAEDALDCNWLFMKDGEPGVPTYTEWLISELTAGQVVGADPFLVTNSEWLTTQSQLAAVGISLVEVTSNPVDSVWTDQPPPPNTTINALDVKYNGRSWQDKVRDVHKAMQDKGVTGATVVTSLDEVAWLFNLRANDIDYVPVFIGYAVVEYYGPSSSNNRIRLYIYDKDARLTVTPSDPETAAMLHVHLNTGEDGSCAGKTGMCVEVLDYNSTQVVSDITALARASQDNKIWVTFLCNFAIFNAIPQAQRVQARSYIALAKSQKNPTERQGMQTCYNRDSAVVVEFLAMLEKEILEGKQWTEVSAAAELKKRRQSADKNRGLSFPTIAGSGPNGAVIHYRPGPETDRRLTTEEMFLLDSGGQYLDCTTDVTRTMHYGTPTAFMKECYTRVLMGSIDLATLVWPEGLYGREIDAVARAPLWSVGLEYNHGTGHGIGHYLSVHEGPGRISLVHTVTKSYEKLHPYMFFSDEPGYYQPGEFGIRLETIVMVDPINTTHGDRYGQKQFLAMKPFTKVPFEPSLIDHTMLSEKQISWLNNYHKETQETIEPLLTTDLAREWLRERTKPYVRPTTSAAPSSRPLPTLTFVVLGIVGMLVTFSC